MQLFYNPDISSEIKIINFNKDESRHMVKVLRKRLGDSIHITNGKGDLFVAEISSTDVKNCTAIIKQHSKKAQRKYKLHLAVAPTKMNDRYEWFLEKATEIGVDTITPIICDQSERTIIKIERFEKIIQSAMKQSLQCYLPQLNAPMPFNDFIDQEFSGYKFIAHCEETTKMSLKSQLRSESEYVILIGPEGDFSVKEIEIALQRQYKPVTLGKTRLRTETAAIVACHSVAFLNE